MDYKRNSSGSHSHSEDPPLSRLFIIGPKTLTEDDYRKHFDDYGTIDEIWMVNDKSTGEYKGVTYIKYSKTSEAANALEKMNGSLLANGTRRIKVMIAASRDQGSKRDTNEEEKMQRLFIVCPKSITEDALHEHFGKYGELEYISIIKDRQTRESKGIAYIKYQKFSEAAKAFEECDRKYRPVFAEPKNSEPIQRRGEPKDFYGGSSRGFSDGARSGNSNSAFSVPSNMAGPSGVNEGFNKLTVIASPDINQDQLWKLFDIVPGLDYCQLRYEGGQMRPARAVGEIVYTSSQWAAHAREKLHGFEYPPGFRLIVKPVVDGSAPREDPENKKNLMHIAETIAQASSLIQAAGLNPSSILNLGGLADTNTELECSVPLPDPKPLASIDDECVARCFIVCTTALPKTVLRDLFCRFGNLIEAYMLVNKKCGYARYTDRSSCEKAIEVLHGAEVNGVRLKVIVAEEQRKRPRFDDDAKIM